MDAFAKLMRIQIVPSLKLILSRLTSVLEQLDVVSSQNQLKAVKICEAQLEYLIRVICSMFGSGLPSSSTRLNKGNQQQAQETMESEESKEEKEEPWAYIDFQIVKLVFHVYKSTTMLRKHQYDPQLEQSLLNFAIVFKSYILTDSRIIALCSRLAEERG